MSEDTYGNGFPTRKDLLAELAEEAVTPRYVFDENGNRIKDPEGKDWILPKGSIYINGEPLEFFALEQEQADAVMDAIAKIDFSPKTGIEDTVIEIIGQEAKDFFDGRKTGILSVSKTADHLKHLSHLRSPESRRDNFLHKSQTDSHNWFLRYS